MQYHESEMLNTEYGGLKGEKLARTQISTVTAQSSLANTPKLPENSSKDLVFGSLPDSPQRSKTSFLSFSKQISISQRRFFQPRKIRTTKSMDTIRIPKSLFERDKNVYKNPEAGKNNSNDQVEYLSVPESRKGLSKEKQNKKSQNSSSETYCRGFPYKEENIFSENTKNIDYRCPAIDGIQVEKLSIADQCASSPWISENTNVWNSSNIDKSQRRREKTRIQNVFDNFTLDPPPKYKSKSEKIELVSKYKADSDQKEENVGDSQRISLKFLKMTQRYKNYIGELKSTHFQKDGNLRPSPGQSNKADFIKLYSEQNNSVKNFSHPNTLQPVSPSNFNQQLSNYFDPSSNTFDNDQKNYNVVGHQTNPSISSFSSGLLTPQSPTTPFTPLTPYSPSPKTQKRGSKETCVNKTLSAIQEQVVTEHRAVDVHPKRNEKVVNLVPTLHPKAIPAEGPEDLKSLFEKPNCSKVWDHENYDQSFSFISNEELENIPLVASKISLSPVKAKSVLIPKLIQGQIYPQTSVTVEMGNDVEDNLNAMNPTGNVENFGYPKNELILDKKRLEDAGRNLLKPVMKTMGQGNKNFPHEINGNCFIKNPKKRHLNHYKRLKMLEIYRKSQINLLESRIQAVEGIYNRIMKECHNMNGLFDLGSILDVETRNKQSKNSI